MNEQPTGSALPPSGTVTFLFTDIEGSTKLWEHHPDWMEGAHKRQEQIIRDAVARHSGYPYKMIGDAFQVAFVTPRAALCAALEAQRALHSEFGNRELGVSLRVRMALHTGVTEERGDDYVGPALNRAARLMSAGHGGQVLLSQATFGLVRDQLPADISLLDLGEHRLKDLIRPEHIYQLRASDLPFDFPALKTLDLLPNNLPVQLTSFIGREREIARVKELLAGTRLLALTGAGGAGKTRLALQVAADLSDEIPDGVWFIELAPLSDAALVAQSVANVLGLREEANRPALTLLADYLRAKTILLILDNCEHLLDACAKFADAILHAAPKTKILATSREAIGIAGETTYRVPSLSFPDLHDVGATHAVAPEDDAGTRATARAAPADILQYEAVRLFLDRALAAQPDFALTLQNAPAVAQICQRLDGIPLALELAAARVKVLSVEQISKKLDDRFKLLTGGSRTALPRQQTLRALIDWSYNLLSEPERILLRRLAVFAGGWSLEAAQAVCSCDPVCADDVLDLLAHLVDKSLVIVESHGDAARYRLIETIRQYARDKLLESGEGETIRNRHLDHFLKFAEEVEPKLHSAEQLEWLARLEGDHDNLRTALEWSRGDRRVEKGLQLAAALMWFWEIRVYWNEARQQVPNLLNQPEAAPRTLARAKALLVPAFVGGRGGAGRLGRPYAEQAVAIAREQGAAGKRVLALGLASLSKIIFEDDPVGADSMLEEALAIARLLGDSWLIALLLNIRGDRSIDRKDLGAARIALEESLARFQSFGDKTYTSQAAYLISYSFLIEGNLVRARQEVEQSLRLFRQEKNNRAIHRAVKTLGEIARVEGRYDLAKGYYLEALEIARGWGTKWPIAIDCGNLGFVSLHEDNLNSAKSLFAEALTLRRELDSKTGTRFALQGYASVAAVEKQARRAVKLFAVVAPQYETSDFRSVSPANEAEYKRYLARAREQLDEAEFNAAWEEGKQMTLEQAIEYALNVPEGVRHES